MINLIFLPYAGGNSYSYNSFRQYLDGKVCMITPELPGRGSQYQQPFITDIYAMADYMFEKSAHLFREPFALYGHSMGGVLAYLMARKIKAAGLPAPLHFFCSGCRAPSIARINKYHDLPREAFISKLRELGGSPDEILNNEEAMEFYLPIIRADFKAIETFRYQPGEPLDVPITVLISHGDRISTPDAEAWQQETSCPVSILSFTGGHFFILDHTYDVCRIILRRLPVRRVV